MNGARPRRLVARTEVPGQRGPCARPAAGGSGGGRDLSEMQPSPKRVRELLLQRGRPAGREAVGRSLRSATGMLLRLPRRRGAGGRDRTLRSGESPGRAAPLLSRLHVLARGHDHPRTRHGDAGFRRWPRPARPPYLCCSPTSPSVITWGTSSSVGHTPEAMQPNTPHSSRMPSSSSSMARGGGRPGPRSAGSRALLPAPRAANSAAPRGAAGRLPARAPHLHTEGARARTAASPVPSPPPPPARPATPHPLSWWGQGLSAR